MRIFSLTGSRYIHVPRFSGYLKFRYQSWKNGIEHLYILLACFQQPVVTCCRAEFLPVQTWELWQLKAAMLVLTVSVGWSRRDDDSSPLSTCRPAVLRLDEWEIISDGGRETGRGEAQRDGSVWLPPPPPSPPLSLWFRTIDLGQSCCYQTLHSATLNI